MTTNAPDLGRGRVVIITGAGRGIGRAEALSYAAHGFRVVVNDLGADVDGKGARSETAQQVVDEIRSAGGEAMADAEDVADFDGAKRMIDAAVEHYGQLDVLVNNAGILRDRTVANMSAEEWDGVIRVHLRGTFCPLRHAAAYWRELAKSGRDIDARIINTSSGSGLYGNQGQSNYGAAKAGIAALTIIASQELERYGVAVNAIAPVALTRMTLDLPHWQQRRAEVEQNPNVFNPFAPENNAPLVVWLGTDAAKGITGRVFNVGGGKVEIAEPWGHGPNRDKGGRWNVDELDDVVPNLLEQAHPITTIKPVKRKGQAVGSSS
jgi:NAD(P)-dependent dehydrogenase (short-subunit alcohol dehydrogenase family)